MRTAVRVVGLSVVLLLVFAVACAPAAEKTTPAPAPAPVPTTDRGVIEFYVTDPLRRA